MPSTIASRPAIAANRSIEAPNTQPGATKTAAQLIDAIALAGTYCRAGIRSMPAIAGTKGRTAPT
jgi:hypothetical protein